MKKPSLGWGLEGYSCWWVELMRLAMCGKADTGHWIQPTFDSALPSERALDYHEQKLCV